jgi:hypothetical protein
VGEHSQEMTSYQCWQTSRWLSFSVFYLGVLRRNWARKSKQRRGLGDDTHLRTADAAADYVVARPYRTPSL